jgi:hypothetical protein
MTKRMPDTTGQGSMLGGWIAVPPTLIGGYVMGTQAATGGAAHKPDQLENQPLSVDPEMVLRLLAESAVMPTSSSAIVTVPLVPVSSIRQAGVPGKPQVIEGVAVPVLVPVAVVDGVELVTLDVVVVPSGFVVIVVDVEVVPGLLMVLWVQQLNVTAPNKSATQPQLIWSVRVEPSDMTVL